MRTKRQIVKYRYKKDLGSIKEYYTFKGLRPGDVLIANKTIGGIGGDFVPFPMNLIVEGEKYKVAHIDSINFWQVPWIIDNDGNSTIPNFDDFEIDPSCLIESEELDIDKVQTIFENVRWRKPRLYDGFTLLYKHVSEVDTLIESINNHSITFSKIEELISLGVSEKTFIDLSDLGWKMRDGKLTFVFH